MKNLKKVTLLTLALGALVLASGCTRKDEDGKLIVFHGSEKDDAKSLDPVSAYDTISLDILPSIDEALYQYSYLSDTFKLEPLLAASMPKFSKDRLTVTIPIKKGVRFQDDPCFKGGKGRELKAQDFIYEFKRLALPSLQSQGAWIFEGKLAGFSAFEEKLAKAAKKDRSKIFDEDIEGVKALDDYTLQLKLVRPYPQLLYVLAMTFTAPVPHEAVEKYGDEQGAIIAHPVGTGPYKLKRWRRNERIVLVRNPNFRHEVYPSQGSLAFQKRGMLDDAGKTIPFIDVLNFEIVKEDQPRWLNFLDHKKDVIEIPKDNFNNAIVNQTNLSPEFSAKGIRLNIESGVVFRWIQFNMKDKLLGSNKYLRQALASAINRDKWIQVFTNGTGKKMSTILPPGLADRADDMTAKYGYDLARAKDLLKKAGFPNGQGLPVLNFDLRGAETVSRQFGDFMSQEFGAIGVKINVILNTFPAYLEKEKQGDLTIAYGGWAMDYPDAENAYQLFYGKNISPGPNAANYQNPKFDKLYEKMAVLDPGRKRAALIRKMEDIIQEDCPWAMGYYEATYTISWPWLQNYRRSDIILNPYKYYRIDKEIKKRYLEQLK